MDKNNNTYAETFKKLNFNVTFWDILVIVLLIPAIAFIEAFTHTIPLLSIIPIPIGFIPIFLYAFVRFRSINKKNSNVIDK